MSTNNNRPVGLPGVRSTGPSRRNFLRGVGVGGAAVAGGGLLAGCGSSPQTAGEGPEVEDQSDVDKTLNITNWPLYIDQKKVDGEVTRPTIDAFEQKTGITVNYTENVNDNDSFYTTVRPLLSDNKPTPYDCFILTDWMASKMINLGYLEEIDKTNIPNFKNLTPALASPSWDPDRKYSIPWQSGLTGIAYDSSQVDPVTSINQLLTDPNLAGAITVLVEMRDTMGLIMLDQGNNPEDFDQAAWDEAFQMIQDATDNQQIRQFTGNDYAQPLAKGDLKACMAWSGDVVQLQFDNPNIKFLIPDGGAMLWSDNMLIPNGASHKKNAELWMNYYYDPVVAAEVEAWVNYISPVVGAKEELEKIDPDLAENPLIFPSDDDFENLSIFRGLTPTEDAEYTAQFQTLFT